MAHALGERIRVVAGQHVRDERRQSVLRVRGREAPRLVVETARLEQRGQLGQSSGQAERTSARQYRFMRKLSHPCHGAAKLADRPINSANAWPNSTNHNPKAAS